MDPPVEMHTVHGLGLMQGFVTWTAYTLLLDASPNHTEELLCGAALT